MRRFLTAFLLIFVSHVVCAQIKFEVQAPLSVSVGERFQVVLTLTNGEGENFVEPKITGADVAFGPVVSSGFHVISGTGQKTQSASYQRFTYTLDATSNSKITIGAASISVGGKRYGTKPLSIEVSNRSNQQSRQQGGGSAQQPQQKVSANDLIIGMEVSPTSVYKGQALLAQLKIYNRVQVQVVPEKFPAFNGFWAQELPVTNQAVRATRNGKIYESQVIRQWLLYPQKAGKLEIEQSTYNAQIQVAVPIDFGDDDLSRLAGMMMGSMNTMQIIERKLTSSTVEVDVKPLPSEGMPADFGLALGDFTLSSSISSRTFTANSGGTVKISLIGTGNFPLIDAPKLIFPEGVEGYQAKMSEVVTNTAVGTSGERSWEFPFVVRSEGEFDIPSVEMSYFNPRTGRYHSLRSEAYKITVTSDPNGGKGGVITTFSGNEDIKPLRTAIPTVENGAVVLYSTGFFGAVAAIFIAFWVALWALRRRMALRADVVGRKLKRASRVALKKLKKAKGFMDTDNSSAFFEEMLRAMWGFVGDKFNINSADMSKGNIGAQFAQRGYDEGLVSEFLEIVEQCEFARYAPASSGDMRTIYTRTLALFSSL